MMKKINNIAYQLVFLGVLGLYACEDFVEVEVPDHLITGSTVFANEETAQSAMTGIYNQLFNASFANGGNRSVTFLAALSADNFKPTSNIVEILEFSQNAISPDNTWNLDLWAGSYHTIYEVNALLEGVAQAQDLPEGTKSSLTGQAKFIRAFTYFYLHQLYGDVPLLLETDYRANATAPRASSSEVEAQILSDLQEAIALLPEEYPDGDRTRPNKYTAMGLLARVYLFQENWEQAAYYSEQVISQASLYELLADPNEVFLANSREALWQISPIGWGSSFTHTREGNLFIKDATTNTPVALAEDFMEVWSAPEDLRFINWIASFQDGEEVLYYPYKYKIAYEASGGEITEYSMVLRLAEQYAIQAEAQAQLGNLTQAMNSIDHLRERAGVPLLAEATTTPDQEELLSLILQERRKEFFAEWGHRWLDLKRTGNTALLSNKPQADWEATDSRYPIPQQERLKNTYLSQNPGY